MIIILNKFKNFKFFERLIIYFDIMIFTMQIRKPNNMGRYSGNGYIK